MSSDPDAPADAEPVAREVAKVLAEATFYAQVPLFALLINMLKKRAEETTSPAIKRRCKTLTQELEALRQKEHCAMSMSGEDLPDKITELIGEGAEMRFWMQLGKKDYKHNIAVFEGMEKSVYGRYDILRKLATGYWELFKATHKLTYNGLVSIFGEETIEMLKNPEDARLTLCWDPEHPARVVIVSAYRGKEGFYKIEGC